MVRSEIKVLSYVRGNASLSERLLLQRWCYITCEIRRAGLVSFSLIRIGIAAPVCLLALVFLIIPRKRLGNAFRNSRHVVWFSTVYHQLPY